MLARCQNAFSWSTKLYKAFIQVRQFQQLHRLFGGVQNYWHPSLDSHSKTTRMNIQIFTEELNCVACIVFSLLCRIWMLFLEEGVFSLKLYFCLAREQIWVPHAQISCSVASFDLSDAKQLGSFPLRKKMSFNVFLNVFLNVFFFSVRAKNACFPYTAVSCIISQQSYSPHD